MPMKIIITLLILLVSTSCKHKIKHYKIKEGNHRSNFFGKPLISKKIDFSFAFDETAFYDDPSTHINKLYGFADCRSHHHKNSFRIGWRANKEVIELFAYIYTNGTRLIGDSQGGDYDAGIRLINISPGEIVDVVVKVLPHTYDVTINEQNFSFKRGCGHKRATGYTLGPYFGGMPKAPHDINIYVAH
jgi:hypothetical protein